MTTSQLYAPWGHGNLKRGGVLKLGGSPPTLWKPSQGEGGKTAGKGENPKGVFKKRHRRP